MNMYLYFIFKIGFKIGGRVGVHYPLQFMCMLMSNVRSKILNAIAWYLSNIDVNFINRIASENLLITLY